MNCGNEMVDAILKMEKLAVAAPELARHIIYLCQTAHQAYHNAPKESNRPWYECPRPFCASSVDIVKLTNPELLRGFMP